jgi:hypothetical protein
MQVKTANFVKNSGRLADRPRSEPATITKNGQERRVVRVEDLTDEEVALIAKSEVPAAYAHLDDEIEHWRP